MNNLNTDFTINRKLLFTPVSKKFRFVFVTNSNDTFKSGLAIIKIK